MRRYLKLFAAMMRQHAKFSMGMFLVTVSEFFSLGALLGIWAAISLQYSIPGYTFPCLVVYLTVARIVDIGARNRVDRNLADQIYRGSLTQELRLPINHQVYTIIKVLSRNVWSFLYGAGVTIVLSTLFVRYTGISYVRSAYPGYSASMLLGVPALSLAVCLSVSLNYTIGLVAMWTKTQKAIAHLKDLFSAILSGALIPLDLFPNWLRQVSDAMPFRWIVYAPTRILIGSATSAEALRYLVIQILWIVMLCVANRVIWTRAVRRLEVYGG
jgi:ABC-2 type transport system permease protein